MAPAGLHVVTKNIGPQIRRVLGGRGGGEANENRPGNLSPPGIKVKGGRDNNSKLHLGGKWRQRSATPPRGKRWRDEKALSYTLDDVSKTIFLSQSFQCLKLLFWRGNFRRGTPKH